MTRQEEYAEQEARLIEATNAKNAIDYFIKNVHYYNYNRESVQELIHYQRLSVEDQATVLESFNA